MSNQQEKLKYASQLYRKIFPSRNFYTLRPSDYLYVTFMEIAEEHLNAKM